MSPKGKQQAAAFEPLPRGHHGLSAEEVRSSQRDRLLRAMLASVARRGYAATTVPQVVADARVSRNAFYELFNDKEDCFIALCDESAAELIAETRQLGAGDDWVEAVRLGFRRYLRWWQDRQEFTRAYFVELPSAGPRAIEQRDRAYEPFRQIFRDVGAWARASDPELPALGDLTVRLLVISITELIAEEVRAGRGHRLMELEDELTHHTVKLLLP
jgi:AcrR family transcriptional regulator